MLQEILADQNLFFFTFHAFLIGAAIGYLIARHTIKKIKGKLKSQSRAYDELMAGFQATSKTQSAGSMHVIRMNTETKRVAGLAYS